MKSNNIILVYVIFEIGFMILVPSYTIGKLISNESDKFILNSSNNFAPFPPQKSSPSTWASYISKNANIWNKGLKISQNTLKFQNTAEIKNLFFDNFNTSDNQSKPDFITFIGSTIMPDTTLRETDDSKRWEINTDYFNNFGVLKVTGKVVFYITVEWSKKNATIDELYHHYVVGLDYTLNNLLPEEDLYLILHRVQQIKFPNKNSAYQNFDINRLSRQIFMGKADLDINDFAKLVFLSIYNFQGEDWLVQPGIEYSIADNIFLASVIDMLGGPDDSFFGRSRDKYRIQIKINYSF